MTEVLDFYGVWSTDLILLMLPVAIQLEAERSQADFNSTVAAVGSLFDKKAAEAFTSLMNNVKEKVEEAQLRNRGLEPKKQEGHTEADKFVRGLEKIGLNVPRGSRPGRGRGKKPATEPTRIHKAK